MKRTLLGILLAVISFGLGWARCWYGFTDPTQHDLQWQFVAAAGNGNILRMQALLAIGARVDDIPSSENGAVTGNTALYLAAHAGESEAVAWLLDHGADPNHDTGDARPLGAAQQRAAQSAKVVELLKARGAKYP
jgi:hypothetical protein